MKRVPILSLILIFLLTSFTFAGVNITGGGGSSTDLTSPGPIGGTTPAAGTFTNLTVQQGSTTFNQVAAPATAPTTAIKAVAGNLNGAYFYRVSYVTAVGETQTGTLSAVVNPANQQVDLTNIPVSSNSAVTSRKIYRSLAGGVGELTLSFMKLVTTIADNTTTTYTDNTADGSLGAVEPRVNTTGNLLFNGTVRSGIFDPATTAFGYNALLANTGWLNSAFGESSLKANTTGYYNSGFGQGTLQFNTTGYGNSAVGVDACRTNTTGNSNVAVGWNALATNSTGVNDVAVGVTSLYNATSNNNTSIGHQSLQGTTTGANNAALGYNAGLTLTTGSSNVFLGSAAGQNASQKVDAVNSMALGANTFTSASNQFVYGDANVTNHVFQGSSAASTPQVTLTGTWFTGGSATTTKPHLLIEPTGTTSTGWATGGTGLGINAAAGFTGNLFDGQVAGVSKAYIRNDGYLVLTQGITATAITLNSGSVITGGTMIPGNTALITAGTGTGVTVVYTGIVTRVLYKVTVTYQALAAAALTADKVIATLPAKTRLVSIIADTTIPYTGGTVSAASLIVGKTTGGAEYIATHDVLSAAIVRGLADADMGTSMTRAAAIQGGDLPSWTGTTDISVRLTTVTANTNALTAGSTTYYLVTERF